MAAILVLVKPLYALGLGLPVLLLVWKQRSLHPVFSPDLLTIAFMGLAYSAILILAFPIYLNDIAPMLVDVYLPYRRAPAELFSILVLPVLVPFTLTFFVRSPLRHIRPATQTFLLASIGFTIAFLLSGKGWLYHLYPALVCAFVALLSEITNQKASRQNRLVFLVAGLTAFGLTAYGDFRQSGKDVSIPSAIAKLDPAPRLAVVTLDIAFGVPLAERLNADWKEKDHSDYVGGLALAQLSNTEGYQRETLERYIQTEINRKASYLAAEPVDLIVLDLASPRWVKMVIQDPRMAAYLEDYHEIARTQKAVFLARQ